MAYDSQSQASADPAADPDANYNYQSDNVEDSQLVADLEARVDGDVRFDSFTRQLFATDSSAYKQLPIGVVSPKSTDDVVAVMEYCADNEIPVLPRGGGTSLAGQAVNEAVVLDFKRYMSDMIEFDPDAETARAQPGITIAHLNDHLEPHGLKFAPDPAWGDKSVLAGAIGNNTTGAHSLKYGKTDAYVEEVEVVLADGTQTTFGWVEVEDLHDKAEKAQEAGRQLEAQIYAEVGRIIHEDADEIMERYPDLKRNVSGYNLDMLVDEAKERGEVNLGRLMAGSEGTLAIITEATVSLEPIPNETAIVMLTYDGVLPAMRDVAPILEHDPSAVEIMDEVFLDLARDSPQFSKLVDTLPEGTESTLLVEFYADTPEEAKQKIADMVADRLPSYETAVAPSDDAGDVTDADIEAVDALEAYDDDRQAKFWKMRKAGLPILLSRTGDDKHWPFVEDTAVPPEKLPDYISDLQDLFDEYDTFAAYYAHAGPGVLHIRPLLNLKTEEGLEHMHEISDAITDLVIEYGGSISGEHGDGRARTEWNEKLYGENIWEAFRDLKSAFDPQWLLNPGSVCGDYVSNENLRYDPDYTFDASFEPRLNWENENGFQGMVELCHGCAGCTGYQDTTGGVMCPTYRATEGEEITSTRGRANMLRSAMEGDLPEDLFSDEFIHEVMDLCIGCKGCRNDCPSGVDMAKLKAEVVHEYHQREGLTLRDRMFANYGLLAKLGSTFAPLSNWAMNFPGSGWLLEKTVGISSERDLPAFKRNTLKKRMSSHSPKVSEAEAERKALVLPDPYTNFNHPEVGMAGVEILEAAGVHVKMSPDVTDSGRPAYSKSMLDHCRATAEENVEKLAPWVEDGWDIVAFEPSDAVMYQLDYPDLVSGPDVDLVSENAYSVLEYLDVFRLDENIDFGTPSESLAYHGHCQQKATQKDHHAVGVLRRAGFEVDALDSACCGMAGSFGYEREHLSMSMSIGEILFEQIDESPGEQIVAPGTSCRSQILEHESQAGEEPPHPVEKLASLV